MIFGRDNISFALWTCSFSKIRLQKDVTELRYPPVLPPSLDGFFRISVPAESVFTSASLFTSHTGRIGRWRFSMQSYLIITSLVKRYTRLPFPHEQPFMIYLSSMVTTFAGDHVRLDYLAIVFAGL